MQNVQVQKRPGPKSPGGGRNFLVQNVRGRNVLVQNVRGVKRPGPKCQGAKHPGPKHLSPKSPGAKTLPEPSLHDCETSSMIVTFPGASF